MSRPKIKCVLLAERNSGLSEGIRGLLETEFEAVLMVADAASLFEGAARLQPALAVVELSLSRVAGFDFLRQMRSQFPDLKMIVLSMHKEPAIMWTCMEAGANGYVLKTSLAMDLLPAVESVLAGKRYISPSILQSGSGLPAANGLSNEKK
jgi:DNA-binding NarL/FixJ family response regulator